MSIKNIWSLNIDEAVAADALKQHFRKSDYEVFFPVNAQLKEIDMLLVNIKTGKSRTIQVKGSRTYEPRKTETDIYGDGSAAWFKIDRKAIFDTTNKLDYYIFVLHSAVDGETRKEISINQLVIPIRDLQIVCKKKNIRADGVTYNFFIWIDPKGKRVFDMQHKNGGTINLTKYFNNFSLIT